MGLVDNCNVRASIPFRASGYLVSFGEDDAAKEQRLTRNAHVKGVCQPPNIGNSCGLFASYTCLRARAKSEGGFRCSNEQDRWDLPKSA
jgi:hypothetical protein